MFKQDVLSAQERMVLGLRELYEGYGYTRFPMRRFEEYSLYLENKSFLTSERVLSFTNANGKLMALKPDVTLSIVKRAHAERSGVEKLYYNESVYRVSPTDHEFTEIEQIGVEYLGDVDLYGTCEVLRLAIESLRQTGAPYVLDVSHMGFAGGLMADAGLTAEQRGQAFELISQKNAHELETALKRWQIAPIYAERIAALPSLAGDVSGTLTRAANIAVGAEMKQAVGELSRLYGALDSLGLAECVRLDFSLLNDLDYYNGLVFQGYVEGAPRMVLGGGRYDRLMRKFGKEGGGLGFALYLNELDRVLAKPCRIRRGRVGAIRAAGRRGGGAGRCGRALRRGRARAGRDGKPAGLRVGRKLRFTGTGFEEVTEEC